MYCLRKKKNPVLYLYKLVSSHDVHIQFILISYQMMMDNNNMEDEEEAVILVAFFYEEGKTEKEYLYKELYKIPYKVEHFKRVNSAIN